LILPEARRATPGAGPVRTRRDTRGRRGATGAPRGAGAEVKCAVGV